MQPRVYLAGPISNVTYGSATDWRNTAARALADAGIAAFSPMRNKQFLAQHKGALPHGVVDHTSPLATPKGIMSRDRFDCINADALLINYSDAPTVSYGTAMEVAWANMKHKPIVVIGSPDNPNISHPMAQEAINFRVDTLEEGIDLICQILLTEVPT